MTKLNQTQSNLISRARYKRLIIARVITLAAVYVPQLPYAVISKRNTIKYGTLGIKFYFICDITFLIFSIFLTLSMLHTRGVLSDASFWTEKLFSITE